MLTDLLARTSRTFALAIPCLPYPARREVTIAYLLFRIADTIEDGIHLDRDEKLAALDRFARLLGSGPGWRAERAHLELPRAPADNLHYLELLDELPRILEAVAGLREGVRAAIVSGTQTSLSGMKHFIAAGNSAGKVRIASVDELRDYCYFVAGVVGEMLTEVFVQGADWLSAVRSELDADARWFGEGLQLVNILKDSAEDERAGRFFVPSEATRGELFELAREDLQKAEAYVAVLKQAEAPPGFVAFTQLPLQLAWRTLECVEANGPGSKVPRDEVMSIFAQALSRVAPNEAASTDSEAIG